MTFEIVRLVVDFGLLVLIWMTQLIIYPSFLFFTSANLIRWHTHYTRLMAYIVGPLMLVQLGIAVFQAIKTLSFFSGIGLGLVILVWLHTFLTFIPLHDTISRGNANEKILRALVHKNWWRTILWSLVFVLSCIDILN
ncbi:MAG: hypothetical protein AAF969_17515 [Bacteroidota bacterium]